MKRFSAKAFAFGGFIFLLMSLYTTIGRLLIDVDGEIVAREMTTGYRPAAIYSINQPGGQTRTYMAGPTDASLPRDLPIGSRLTKRRWELGYTLNNQRVTDFPIMFYGASFGIGAGMLCFSIVLRFQQRRP